MDNLRLLCLVVNVCRGTARRPRYKFSNTGGEIVAEHYNCSFLVAYATGTQLVGLVHASRVISLYCDDSSSGSVPRAMSRLCCAADDAGGPV